MGVKRSGLRPPLLLGRFAACIGPCGPHGSSPATMAHLPVKDAYGAAARSSSRLLDSEPLGPRLDAG